MHKNPSVAEAERFQGADLRFFLGSKAVHRRHHRQNGDEKEEHGEDRTHRLPLFGFALCARIGSRFGFIENHRRIAEGVVDLFGKGLFIHFGNHVNLREEEKTERVFIHHGRDIRKSVSTVVGHQLTFVADADHMFAGFHKSAHHAGDGPSFVYQSQRIAERNPVFRRIAVRKPDTVRRRSVILFAVRFVHTRNGGVLGHRERHGVSLAFPDIGGNRKIAGNGGHAVDRPHFVRVLRGKAGLRHNAVVGISGFAEEAARAFTDTHPFHIETDKNANAERNHDNHGNELRFVQSHRAP